MTHSSGNAAQAIALAATIKNIKSQVVMPKNAPDTKRKATLDYGAEIHLCENTGKVTSFSNCAFVFQPFMP